jgi:hypothetical protein
MIFFKLNFVKACDKVSYDFLFLLAMRKLGMANEFINMVTLLFFDVELSNYFDCNMTPSFQQPYPKVSFIIK